MFKIMVPSERASPANPRNDAVSLAFNNALGSAMGKAQGKLDFILIILPNPHADIYATVKKFCSIDHGSKLFFYLNVIWVVYPE